MSMGAVIGAASLGLVFAIFNFYAWTKFADSVIDPWVRRFTHKKRERTLATLYALALLWAPLGAVLSNVLTHVLLRALRL